MPQIPEELRDQLPLVTEIRRTLFPDKVDPATGEPLPLNDPAKAMLMTKHIAWRLRHLGIGLVKAKPGSENNVDGYTSDIVALPSGDHWDVQQDGHTGAAYPRWAKEENRANNVPIRDRWVPAVDPGGAPHPQPPPVTAETVRTLISEAVAPLRNEMAKLRGEIQRLKDVPAPSFPSRIALKTAHGKYISAEADDRIVADRVAAGTWETFDVEPQQ